MRAKRPRSVEEIIGDIEEAEIELRAAEDRVDDLEYEIEDLRRGLAKARESEPDSDGMTEDAWRERHRNEIIKYECVTGRRYAGGKIPRLGLPAKAGAPQ